MKKLIFLAVALLVFQKWDDINRYINPPPDYAAAHNGQVILYSTDWCPYCKKAKKLMEDNNIAYYEYDIEKSSEGRRQYKSLGGQGVPVLLIGQDVIRGYNHNKILELTGG